MLHDLGIELPADLPIEEDMKRGTWSFKATPVGEDLPLPVDFRIEFGTKERRRAIDDPRIFVARTINIFATLAIDQCREADVVWKLDMMKQLGVHPHNMSTSSPTIWGDLVFAVTSNGVGADHITLPSPHAPSFIAVNKRTGKLVWSDNSPGENVLHGQWSSPAVGVLGGVPQVIFPGGDGWLYSFHAERHKEGKPELLWKFDCNPKDSMWILGGRGTRNNIIAMPVIHEGRDYICVGQDPEHGEGDGHLYCLDPTKRGDVSAELVVHKLRRDKPLPHRRHRPVDPDAGEIVIANPNSAVIWHYDEFDQNLDGKIDFEERMHRTISCPVIKDDVLIVPDFSGAVHCLNAKTGRPHWSSDLLASVWGSPLVVNDRVYSDFSITLWKSIFTWRLDLVFSVVHGREERQRDGCRGGGGGRGADAAGRAVAARTA
jgi:outer membrane protein assembly factor BamB